MRAGKAPVRRCFKIAPWSIFKLKMLQGASEASLISALLIRNALRADG